LRGGQVTTFTDSTSGNTNLMWDSLRMYFLVGWDSQGHEMQMNHFYLREFPNSGWRLIVPGFSPPATNSFP